MPIVVYRPFPTSNHNPFIILNYGIMLYIVRFLHQTTTLNKKYKIMTSCISSVSYIKPQLLATFFFFRSCCISSVSYIKPQQSDRISTVTGVVYRPFPTSNHNCACVCCKALPVVYRPFPTSNHNL